jgi:hypothetical protein
MSDLVAKLLAEALERANKAKAIEPALPVAPTAPAPQNIGFTTHSAGDLPRGTEPIVEAKEEETEEEAPAPIVSLVYQSSRNPVTPGIPAEIKVTLETYNEAYCKKLADIATLEAGLRAEYPQMSDAELEKEINDYNLNRMRTLEALMSVSKLEWVMSWRVQEERLKITSEAERERVRKADRAYRSVATGEPKVKKAKAEKAAVVPMDPAKKKEATVLLLMNRLGLSRQAAEERLGMMEALKVKTNE